MSSLRAEVLIVSRAPQQVNLITPVADVSDKKSDLKVMKNE